MRAVTNIFQQVLDGYLEAKSQPFAGHSFKEKLKIEIPYMISDWLNRSDRYQIKGSPGLTQWTHVPWVAILDKLITDSPQFGYYPTFLFKSDMSGFYLTLNQGITAVKQEYKASSGTILKVRSKDYLSKIDKVPNGFTVGEINTEAPKSTDPYFYNFGSIIAKFYESGKLPEDEQLKNDLEIVLQKYQNLVEMDFSTSQVEIAEGELGSKKHEFEESLRMRQHSRIERNKTLVKEVKKQQGTVCKGCGFDFEKVYGAIGKGYIEAHHLIPISKLSGKTALNPGRDFTVLCSNCHRMIHRTEDASLESLIKLLKNPN